jgi:hypothetical protein
VSQVTQDHESKRESDELAERRAYEPPSITVLGTLRELTRGPQGPGSDDAGLGSL